VLLKFIHGGNIRKVREQFGKKNLIDFSASINPFGPSARALGAIKRCAINRTPAVLLRAKLTRGQTATFNPLMHYPDTDCKQLREKLARCLRVNACNIVAGNGSIEIIYLIARTFKPKNPAIVIPTFSDYELALRQAKNVTNLRFIKRLEKDNFIFPMKEVVDAMNKIDLLFLCNPNNPTGDLIPKSSLIELIEIALKKKIFLVLDETFIDFCLAHSVLKYAPENKYLVILRSFSKLWGLPGLRLGYAVSHYKTIQKLKEYQEPWTVNALAQIAGIESLKDRAHFSRSVRFIKNESNFLFEQINKITGLKAYTPSANFIFVKISADMSSRELYNKCGKKGMIIRDCSNFRGLDNRFIRLAVRSRKENLKLLTVLKGGLNG